jgi:hypothetical protein
VYLIAVGDRLAKIAWFSPPRNNEGQIDWHTRDISELSDSMLPKHDPQIEAISADGPGRIALLQETPPRVELIDPKTGRVDRSRGRGAQRNCASVVRSGGVARRRNGATARRPFARRQGKEAGGFH